jgi:hypothetical protein
MTVRSVGLVVLGCALLHAQQPSFSTDTLARDTGSGLSPKSPTGALLRSLLLPGWGQWYVGAYWKAPIFLLSTGVSAYFTVVNHRLFLRSQRELEEAQRQGASAWELARLRAYRDFAVQQRDLALAFCLGAYVLAALDAYVGAELSSFDVSDRLSVVPWIGTDRAGVVLMITRP